MTGLRQRMLEELQLDRIATCQDGLYWVELSQRKALEWRSEA
jgi:hypothetical protein